MSWETANSDDFEFDGKAAKCTGTKGGSKYNALYKPEAHQDGFGVGEDPYYFEIKVKSGQLTIGLTDMAHFGEGFKIKGMFFNTNLTDGGAMLIPDFGPKGSCGPDDTVGVFLKFETVADGVRMRVAYYINGDCLGVGFDVVKPSWDPLFPCVSCPGKGDPEFEIVDDVDAPESFNKKPEEPNSGVYGGWRNETLDCIVSLKKHPDNPDTEIEGNAKLWNKMKFTLSRDDPDSPWKGGPVAGQRRMGPEEVMAQEKKFAHVIEDLESLESEDDKKLIMKASDGETLEFLTFHIPPALPVNNDVLKPKVTPF